MILVTGGTGLVGSHLLYKLVKNGEKVIALVRDKKRINVIEKVFSYYSSDTALIRKIEFVEGDILDIPLLQQVISKVNVIYHCAAIVSFNPKDAKLMHTINVEGTANMVNVALENKIQKFCHVSSTAAIGKDPLGGFNTESTEWNNKGASNYSLSKFKAEQEVWRGSAEGLNTVIVNPTIILGPGDWGKSSTNLFQEVWNGLNFYTTGKNAFVDVRDVVNCMIELMNGAISNERFLIVAEHLSFKDLLIQISTALGKTPPNTKATSLMTSVGWRLEKLKSLLSHKAPRITKESAKSGQSTQLFSNEKIKQAIGYEFISVKQSIEDTAALFLRDNTIS